MTSAIPNYQIVEQIGQGCFGFVFKAWDATNKEYVAIKRIKKVSNVLSREFQCLFEMSNCNNVIRILDFYYSVHNGDKIQNIVFEYMNMNLHQFIQRMKRKNQILDEKQFKGLAYQLLSGLAEMHSKKICHRDLKPENILIDSKGLVKICDLGSSKLLESSLNTPYVVTQYYRAPELILSHTNYTTSIDIWGKAGVCLIMGQAAGCILLEVVLQQVFFEGEDEGDQFFKIIWKLGTPNSEEMQYLFEHTPYREYIIKRIKNQQSKQRWIQKLFWMKDLNNFLNLMAQMLKYIDRERISAAEAMKHPYFNDIFY